MAPSASEQIESITIAAGLGARICFVSGNFNFIHPGHLRILEFASEISDFMVVGVSGDAAIGVAAPGEERLANVRALAAVKYSVLLDEPPEKFIAKLKPEFVVKGKEFEQRWNVEQDVVDSYGGKLFFSSGEMRLSSAALESSEFGPASVSKTHKPDGYPRRHGFTIDSLKRRIDRLAGIKVVVVGDLIVDEYISCEPLGMSQEVPAVVVTPIETHRFIGGAGIVAAHAHGLGAEVKFVTVRGRDEAGEYSEQYFEELGVEYHGFLDDTRPTTIKQRYRAQGQTLLRVNHLRQHGVNADLANKMLNACDDFMADADVLLFSDFNYGCLPQTLVDAIIDLAKSRDVMMAADSQASSQLSDISRFRDMTFITPTEREARLALKDAESGLAILAEKLVEKATCKSVILTLGAEGTLILGPMGDEMTTDRLPAFNSAPKDVAGAGDSLFAGTALAHRAGADIWESAYFGSLAASCQVGQVGNTPLSLDGLLAEIDHSD